MFQFLAHFPQNGVARIVQVAADFAAGCTGMPAAAQVPGDRAGVHRAGGADADAIAAVLLLAQRQAYLHPFN